MLSSFSPSSGEKMDLFCLPLLVIFLTTAFTSCYLWSWYSYCNKLTLFIWGNVNYTFKKGYILPNSLKSHPLPIAKQCIGLKRNNPSAQRGFLSGDGAMKRELSSIINKNLWDRITGCFPHC